MRFSIVLLGLVLILSSCKKETNYMLRIGIDNQTNKAIFVKVYPKSQFIKGEFYIISSYDDLSEMEFTIQPNSSKTLFETTKLDYEPQMLLTEIFDSLTLNVTLETALIIKFKPDSVENYKINMFSDNSIWTYNVLKGSERTSFSSHPFEIYNYNFEILENEFERESGSLLPVKSAIKRQTLYTNVTNKY